MRPVDNSNPRKRKSLSPHGSSKRSRSRDRSAGDPDIIVIEDDENDITRPSGSAGKRAESDSLDPTKVLKLFRIRPASLM